MKNLVKGYFLLFSYGPFVISSILAVLALFIIAITGTCLGEEYLNQVSHWYYWGTFGGIFVNMLLVYTIRSAYITMYDDDDVDDRHYSFSILVTKDGQKIIVTKPIWRTGKQYFINTRAEFKSSVNGKFKNSLVSIPMSLSLKSNEKFDKLNLFDVLVKDQPHDDNLCLGVYMLNIFEKVNKSSQSKIDNIIGEYAQLKISDAELLNQVIEVLDFPEKLFPNVSDAKICLDPPTSSACKGTSCEK